MQIIFDSNIFDDLISGKFNFDLIKYPDVKIYVTHIQIDEINNCHDVEKRARLFLRMIELKTEKIETESFIIGTSRIGSAKLGGDGTFEILKRGNLKNTNDALIGETAIKNNLTLITNDLKIKKRVENLNGVVLTSQESIQILEKA